MDQKSPPADAIGRLDNNTGRLVPISTPARAELSTLRQVRQEMAALYHAAQRGEITGGELKGSVYALTQIAKLIEIDKLEERMEALEKMVTSGEWSH